MKTNFSETIEDYVTKIGRSSKLNEYMKYYEYHRSRSFIDLVHMALGFSISNIFFSETTWSIEANLHMKHVWEEGTKVI